MACSEIDQKFLGTFAKKIGHDNPLLSSMLFKVLGLSVILSPHLVEARQLLKTDPSIQTKQLLELCLHIILLTREGLRMIEQYIVPMVATFSELRVLCYKIRASFYHVYVLFNNQPSISQGPITPFNRPSTPPALTSQRSELDKGKAAEHVTPPSVPQSLPSLQGGAVGGEPPPANFLVPAEDFLPIAFQYFVEASELSEKYLWGSHPLRLSVQVEFTAFLFDCVHDYEASRNLAKATIAEAYTAQEGMDDKMFEDAKELVEILERMARRRESVGMDIGEEVRSVGGTGTGTETGTGTGTGTGSGSRTGSGNGRTIVPGMGGRGFTTPPPPAFPSPGMINPF